jgi:inosose dehydratase
VTSGVRVANAPVSFGVFELTAGSHPHLPGAEDVLTAVAGAGYDGIDLGPPGYLGVGADLRGNLDVHRLTLAGGWVQLHLLEEEELEQDLEVLRSTLHALQCSPHRGLAPRPTLADAGSDARRRAPGRAAVDPELALAYDDWKRLAANLEGAARICREAGLEPTFHHHAGTHVESVAEVEALLESTDIGLCLDTGHLVLAGGRPRDALERWRERIDHVHLKDIDATAARALTERAASMEEMWSEGVFRSLGEGDVGVQAFVASLLAGGYEGWVVVEQDRILQPGQALEPVAAEQARNRAFLRERGL